MIFLMLWIDGADIKVWDVIEELVNATAEVQPKNPFKIDFSKVEAMPTLECALNSGALAAFLKKIYLKNMPYSDYGTFAYKCEID